MKKRLTIVQYFLIVTILLASTLSGCATGGGRKRKSKTTRIPITIYKSAAIDIRSRNIENIAIAAFDDSKFSKDPPGTKVADLLAKSLADTFIYTVKPPAQVNSELMVNGLGIKPFMERAELKAIGNALKVDAFILGEVKKREIVNKSFTKTETIEEETGEGEYVKDDQGKLMYKAVKKDVDINLECRTGMGEVVLRIKLYDAKTGDLIFDRVETLSEEVDAFCYRSGLNPTKMSPLEISQLLDEVTEELCDNFVEQLTPPAKTEIVIFERIPGTDKIANYLVELGIDYAKVGDWNKAIDSFSKCRDKNRDKSEAHYNLGRAYEGYGWTQKALGEYLVAHKLTSKKLYADAVRKAKKIIAKDSDSAE